MKKIYNILLLAGFGLLSLSSCQQAGGNSTGSEYMPDMAHSIAYEANYYAYYSYHAWDGEDSYYQYAKPRVPVAGTVARGYGGDMSHNDGSASLMGISLPLNGHMAYHYENTEEGRTKAMTELTENPFPITESGLNEGKELYTIYCGSCHGDKADGNGYLVRDDGGKYPVQPANLVSDEFANATNGRYYHAIVYGRNLMGSHADKLSYKERWEVIHYLRSLQAKIAKKEYSAEVNTYNSDATEKSISAVNHGEEEKSNHSETHQNHETKVAH